MICVRVNKVNKNVIAVQFIRPNGKREFYVTRTIPEVRLV